MARGVQANSADDFSCRANGAITQYMAVVLDSVENGDHIVSLPSAARDVVHGIIQQTAAASGDRVSVRRGGVSYVVADSAITVGRPLMVGAGATGHVNDVGSDSWASGDGLIGSADDTATASGDIIACKLHLTEIMP
jgi:hypothetical protein